MLLRKIDGEMNVQNCGFSHEMETVATCSTTDSNGSYHERAPSFFEDANVKTLPATTRQPYWSIEIPQKYRVYLPLVRLFTSA